MITTARCGGRIAKVDGDDYWSENGGTQIRQRHCLAYADSDNESVMATRAYWINKAGRQADLFNVSRGFTFSQAKRKDRQFEVAREELWFK